MPPSCCRASTSPTRCTIGRMAELQVGQKVRVLLAQALFGHPQALLLDEPTNHLDLDSIHWLEEFLVRYEGTPIVISHDRHFLNRVCTHIADIDYETIITYTGGYDDMVVAKTQIRTNIEADNAQREKKIAQLNDFIARFGAGTRASQVTSRRKEVERLRTDWRRSMLRRPYISSRTQHHLAELPLEFEGVSEGASRRRGRSSRLSTSSTAARRSSSSERNGAGNNAARRSRRMRPIESAAPTGHINSGTLRWGTYPSIIFRRTSTSAIEGVAHGRWLHRYDPDASRQDVHRPARSDASAARAEPGAVRRQRPSVSASDAVQPEHTGPGQTVDQPRPRGDRSPLEHGAAKTTRAPMLLVRHDEDLLEEVGTRVWRFDRGRIVDFKGTYEELTASHA